MNSELEILTETISNKVIALNVHMSIIESPLRKHNSENKFAAGQPPRQQAVVLCCERKWFMNLHLVY